MSYESDCSDWRTAFISAFKYKRRGVSVHDIGFCPRKAVQSIKYNTSVTSGPMLCGTMMHKALPDVLKAHPKYGSCMIKPDYPCEYTFFMSGEEISIYGSIDAYITDYETVIEFKTTDWPNSLLDLSLSSGYIMQANTYASMIHADAYEIVFLYKKFASADDIRMISMIKGKPEKDLFDKAKKNAYIEHMSLKTGILPVWSPSAFECKGCLYIEDCPCKYESKRREIDDGKEDE